MDFWGVNPVEIFFDILKVVRQPRHELNLITVGFLPLCIKLVASQPLVWLAWKNIVDLVRLCFYFLAESDSSNLIKHVRCLPNCLWGFVLLQILYIFIREISHRIVNCRHAVISKGAVEHEMLIFIENFLSCFPYLTRRIYVRQHDIENSMKLWLENLCNTTHIRTFYSLFNFYIRASKYSIFLLLNSTLNPWGNFFISIY